MTNKAEVSKTMSKKKLLRCAAPGCRTLTDASDGLCAECGIDAPRASVPKPAPLFDSKLYFEKACAERAAAAPKPAPFDPEPFRAAEVTQIEERREALADLRRHSELLDREHDHPAPVFRP
jgi:hypothetical protein